VKAYPSFSVLNENATELKFHSRHWLDWTGWIPLSKSTGHQTWHDTGSRPHRITAFWRVSGDWGTMVWTHCPDIATMPYAKPGSQTNN